MFADYGKSLLACLITAFLMLNKPLFDLGVEDWKAVGSAAVAAWLPVILAALNKNDDRYGRTISE
jgi:hypothetical protein